VSEIAVEKKISTVRKKTSTEHGEVKLRMKRACLCTRGSESTVSFRKFVVFQNY